MKLAVHVLVMCNDCKLLICIDVEQALEGPVMIWICQYRSYSSKNWLKDH